MLGPKEPNLYKDLSQGTVTKGIQIKIFSPPFFLKFFFENLDLDPDGDPDAQSGSGFGQIRIRIAHLDHHLDPDPDFPQKFFKNFFFLKFLLFLMSLL